VLSGDSYSAVCAGVERVCGEGDEVSFLLEGSKDVFTLVHLTGEREFVLEETWLEANQVHEVADNLKLLLRSSSSSLLVEMAEVSVRLLEECLEHWLLSSLIGWVWSSRTWVYLRIMWWDRRMLLDVC